jgi:hypothetical protein
MPATLTVREQDTVFNVDTFLEDVFANPPITTSDDSGDGGDENGKSFVRLMGVREPTINLKAYYNVLRITRDPAQPTLYLLITDAEEERKKQISWVGIANVHPLFPMGCVNITNTNISLQNAGDEYSIFVEGSRIVQPAQYNGLHVQGTRVISFRRREQPFPKKELSDKVLRQWLKVSRDLLSEYASEQELLRAYSHKTFLQRIERRAGEVYDNVSALFPDKEGFFEHHSALMSTLTVSEAPLKKYLPSLDHLIINEAYAIDNE